MNLNGIYYYITGDTQPLPEMAELKVDVIFPLLWGCGGNVDQAEKMAELCKAHVTVPVHHGGSEQAIKQCCEKLPAGIRSAYFLNGELSQWNRRQLCRKFNSSIIGLSSHSSI